MKNRNDDEHTYSTKSNLGVAINYYQEYYKLSSKIENREGLIESPKGLGNCNLELGKYDEAIEDYEKTAQRAAEYKDVPSKVEAYSQIVKAQILKNGVENDKYYQKYLDTVRETCKAHPKNKRINNTRVDLMKFIDSLKDRSIKQEENSFRKISDS